VHGIPSLFPLVVVLTSARTLRGCVAKRERFEGQKKETAHHSRQEVGAPDDYSSY
jgi:hypothetical protein